MRHQMNTGRRTVSNHATVIRQRRPHEAAAASRKRRDEHDALIDVLLVLLVIFLAPRSDAIVIEYTADRQLAINHQPVLMADLETTLRRVFDVRTDKTIFITAAGTLRYGDVVEVIDAAKGAGVQRVGIVTDGMRRAAGLR